MNNMVKERLPLPELGVLKPPGRWTALTARVVFYGTSLLLDTLAVVGALFLTVWIKPFYWVPGDSLTVLITTVPLFVMFEISREAQSVSSFNDFYLGLQRAVTALAAAFLVVIMLIFLTQLGESISRQGLLTFFAIACGLLFVSRAIVDQAIKVLVGPNLVSTLLLIDGSPIDAEPGSTVLDVGKAGLWPDLTEPDYIARLSELSKGFDRIVVACNEDHRYAWQIFLQGSDIGGELVVGAERSLGAVGIGRCSSRDTLIMSRGPLSLANRVQKRAFDLAVALPLLIVLTPLMIAVAIAIALESEGPVLFRQTRIGEGNRHFRIFKFRSMLAAKTDGAGAQSATRDDARISRVGRFIRRTSIDELPQLLNVISGDMSLVGPRPHPLGSLAENKLFWDINRHYWQRHSLRPGITGLAQIRGFRGATDNIADLENRLRCDLEYLSNWSLWLDVRIMLATFRVLVHEKAY